MKKLFAVLLSALIVSACSVEPEQINYGNDQCHFCKMTVVDVQHAAQTVTNKGKQFKYDAIECMINDMADKEEHDYKYLLIADYNDPGQMLEATKATYLISQKIKSPMGAFLSAGKTEAEMQALKDEHEGELFTWTSIKMKINESN